MEAKLVAVVLGCLLGGALSEKEVINEFVDKALAAFSKRAVKEGFAQYEAPDFQGLGVVAKGITIGDLSTIRRIGDATYDRETSVDVFEAAFTLDKWRESVAQFTVKGKTFSAEFVATGNRQSVRAEVIREGGKCTTKWRTFRIDTFGTVKMYSGQPEFSGVDVTDVFENGVKQRANLMLDSEDFKAYLNKNIDLCVE